MEDDVKKRTALDFFRVLYLRKKAIGVIMASAAAASIILSLVLPKIYIGQVTMFPPKTFTAGGGGMSALVGTPVSPLVSPEPLKYYLGILATSAVAQNVAVRVPERSAQRIKRDVSAKTTRNNLIQITYFDRDPKIAAKAANAYAAGLNSYFSDLSHSQANRLFQFLEGELKKTNDQYNAANDSLRIFKEQNKTISLNDEVSHLISASAELEAARRSLVIDLAENDRRLNETQAELNNQLAEDFSTGSLVENPLIQQYQSKLNELEVRLAAVRQELTEAHPDVIQLKTEIQETQAGMQKEIQRVLDSKTRGINTIGEKLKGELVSLQIAHYALLAKESALNNVTGEMDSTMRAMPALAVRYAQLVKLTELYGKLRDSMATKLQDVRIQAEKEIESFLVVDPAVVPAHPEFPNLGVNLLVALGFGLLGSVFYCFLIEYIEGLLEETRS